MTILTFQLRDYQQRLCDAVWQHMWTTTDRILLQCPTGAGKTEMFAEIICRYRQRYPQDQVVCVAHRRELIDQMVDRLARRGVTAKPLYGGTTADPDWPVICASIQTMASSQSPVPPPNRPQSVGLLIIDEAHHVTEGSQYDRLFGWYPHAKVLGVTATPTRLDGKGLDYAFDELIVGPSVYELIRRGYLCPYRYYVGMKPQLDKVRVVAGDYNLSQLAEAVNTRELLGDLFTNWVKYTGGTKSTVTFAVNIKHSLTIRNMYLSQGVPCAHIDGTTPPEERNRILEEFRAKKILVLTNVGIVTEGFDMPTIEVVQLARPTKSLSLYLQMVGRGLRIAEGKSEAIILDHAGCHDEHGLPDDPHLWTLAGVEKRRTRHLSEDGYPTDEPSEYKQETEVVTLDVPMVEITRGLNVDPNDPRIVTINRLLKIQQRNGYKKGWVVFRAIEQHSDLEYVHFRYLAKKLDYKWQWANHQYTKYIEERQHKEGAA